MTQGEDRLHAIDMVWLEMQGDGPPIAIGTVAVAEGPAPDDAELRDLIAERLPRMPRLHQELAPGGLGIRRPPWVEAERLDLAAHIHRMSAEPRTPDLGHGASRRSDPGGGTRRSAAGPGPSRPPPLDVAVSRIMEGRLPRDRPLWDAWVVDDLDGQWALVWRVHHTIADGLAALALLGQGFDLDPAGGGPTLGDAVLAEPAPTRASAPSTDPAAGGSSFVGRAVGAVRSAVPHLAPAVASLVPHVPSSLTAPVGDGRTWSSVDVPLWEVKEAGRAFGATVNDVVLAAVASGFRDLLEHRGEPTDGRVVRNLVPVSMRPSGDGRAHNQISALLGHLPVGIADPVARLHEVMVGVGHGKAAGTPLVGSFLLGLVDHTVPARVQDVAVSTAGRTAPAWFFDTLTTNVPGPQFPVYLRGRRVTAMYPIIPVAGHTCITTGIFSYDGTLNIGVTGDSKRAGDVAVLAGGIRRAVAELAEMADRER